MGPIGTGGGLGAPEIPDIKKPDIQLLMQDNAQARRELFEERRHTQKRVEEERERARYDVDRVRTDLTAKLKSAERENDALITALGRLREENDQLREEIAVLKISKSNGHVPVPAAAEPRELLETRSSIPSPIQLGPVGTSAPVLLMPPPGPKLGKTVLIDPPIH